MIAAALSLAARGVPVFPCLATKAPACPGGFKAAVTDPEAVRALFRRHPGELIGVPTGPVSGLDALDLDMDAGADEWLSEFCTNLPTTRMHDTRSGGYHLLFRHHPGLRNSASKLGPGVDVRAKGGYVCWWPAAGLPVKNKAMIALWPEWIIERLTVEPAAAISTVTAPIPPIRSNSRYVAAAVERACASVTDAREGTRNDCLYVAVRGLSRLVGSDLSSIEVAQRLARAALDAGLESKETARTIASALKARAAA